MGDGRLRRWASEFFDAADSDGCWDGSSGWDGRVDTLDDAFGCYEDVAKVWGEWVGCRLSNEHVLLRPRGVAMV